jgi:hypothetical protein
MIAVSFRMTGVPILPATAIVAHWTACLGLVLGAMLLLSTGIIVLMPLAWFSVIADPPD